MQVAALFVATDGVYFTAPGMVVPYDGTPGRDAREYAGPAPVVAHPPCARWGNLWWSARHLGKGLGDDDGCFAAALEAVRHWGGLLEHPKGSRAWPAFGLPKPKKGSWTYADGVWVTEVYQRNYGHRALKATWLLAVGPRPPDMDWSPPAAYVTIARPMAEMRARGVELMGRKERSATPLAFAVYLVRYALACGRGE